MNEIMKKVILAPNVILMDIYSPIVSKKCNPGQFILLRIDQYGERIPLTIADFDRSKETVTIIFQVVGKTTLALSSLNVGDSILDFIGPLGMPYEYNPNNKNYMFIAGGLGIPAIYSKIKLLHEKGKYIDIIIGGRAKENIFFEEELRNLSNNLYITTNDGSYGQKGFVTDALKPILENGQRYDEIFAVGPIPMMKAVVDLTREYNIKTLVSLNPIMVDGTGMCGGCRVKIGNEIKFACVDGPIFDGFLVDFDLLMKRNSYYIDQEKKVLEEHKCKIGLGE
ncbi:sulfide/dihydroorotate dehydrogenase-like FAD/NAD-binding protein [Caldicellulosiruptoraceae bacterium PP1]